MTIKKHVLLLGGHMSIAGGFYRAIDQGQSIHCSAIQIFTKSNRQWNASPIKQEEIHTFKQALAASKIHIVVAHATYLINLASADQKIAAQSIAALKNEIHRCDQLGIPYLVLHPGAYIQGYIQDGIDRLTENLNKTLEQTQEYNVMILLENMAGQGSTLGGTFEQLAAIHKAVAYKKKVGVAFDTCHAFAAGYDFTSGSAYEQMWKLFDATIGINLLKTIHVNDSLKERGSHVDRHADIGKGKIGLNAFELLFNDPRFFDIPKILETPWEELKDYERNMNVIKGLLSSQTKEKLEIV